MPNCALLHNHLCMGTDNKWRVCCKFQGDPRPDISSMSHNTFKSLDQYKEIVQTMETGWHPGCHICKETEEDGRAESLRQVSNREFSQIEGIESIELSLSIDCNLKCRMCGPKYSTKWVDIIDQNPPLIETQDFDPYNINHKFRPYSVKDILGDKDLSRLQMVKFLGGEPFVSQQIYDLFDLLNEQKIIHNIDFQTNTNCTVFPEKLLKHLSKFRRIVITLSIDGYGDLNDYIRDGRPWNTVASTLEKWKQYREQHHNCILLLVPSVQAYNIHDLSNIKKIANDNGIKFKFQYVRAPKHFSLNALPPQYLDSIRDEINTTDIDKAVYDNEQFQLFKKFTRMLDLAYGKDIKDYIPKLAEYFQ
jgi:MoaA/NifB/PqqE/SkfB family radical SAM enzyme